MSNDFARDREGFRFNFLGMKTNARPDTLKPGQYPIAVNVRAYSDGTIRTRPGLTQLFQSTPAASYFPFLDMRAYTAFESSTARILAYDAHAQVWLDNGTLVGNLGVVATPGAAMIPFRPNASPTPWMYIANGQTYQKFSAPSPAVTQQNVGIAEPQTPPDAAVMAVPSNQSFLGDPNNRGGTAGVTVTNTRVNDFIVASLLVDAPLVGSQYYSLQVHSGIAYARFQFLTDVTAGGAGMRVYDVFQPMSSAVAIQGIYYFSGTTGRCVIVPAGLAAGVSNEEQSLYGQNLLSALRRGALVSIAGEICLVLSATRGPSGSISFETVTQNPHSTADTMQTVPAIMVSAPGFTPAAGDNIHSNSRGYQVTVGIGTMSVATSGGFIANLASFQPDDYVHVSILVDDLTKLNEMKILLDVGDGSFTQNFYYYTVRPADIVGAVANSLTQVAAAQTVTQRALIDEERAIAANNQGVTASSAQTSPGSSQWSEILFPITAMTRVGNDETLSLQTVNGFQLLWNAAGTINVQHGELDSWVFGGGQVDVGDVGAPYQYRIRPRSSLTGVRGNPSPATRYGVNPRRQTVNVTLPVPYDPQIDTWDVFRYGGSVTEWRRVGSTPAAPPFPIFSLVTTGIGFLPFAVLTLVSPAPTIKLGDVLVISGGSFSPFNITVTVFTVTSSTIFTVTSAVFAGYPTDTGSFGGTAADSAAYTFVDNYDDIAAQQGELLDFDNFEPWPTVDVPNTGVLSVQGAVGTIATVASADPDINRYLPGTLVQIGGGNVYTLWTRPTSLGAGTYLLQFVENVGTAAVFTPYLIQEPAMAAQPLPYMWGPDASGTVFACGDPIRPGTLYFAKNYNPDAAPDSYNQEISPPSEPLLGGETLDGLAFVASSERWWALYPQPQDVAQRYSVVQQPLPRGLAAPYGHCTDGQSIYWWAKDGIWSSAKGSLTDDLYNVFPHDGIVGENYTYAGVTAYAPDYTRSMTFRLAYSLGYLYATYQDSTGTYRSLTLDMRGERTAWCVDLYPLPGVTSVYHVEQSPQANSAVTLLATAQGPPSFTQFAIVAKQSLRTNDVGQPIFGFLGVNEFDGGDARAPKQWGDFFMDLLPAAAGGAGVAVTPMSLGAIIAAPTVIPTAGTRQRSPISVGGIVISDFLGLTVQWSDDYTIQTTETKLFLWQPSFVIQPARTITWQTFGTSYGIDGYMHVRQVSLAYVCTQPITLTCTTYDGQNPAAPITIPSSGGVYAKALFPLGANKGQLYKWTATSTAPFQIFMEDSEIYVGAWGRQGPYSTPGRFGGEVVQPSPI